MRLASRMMRVIVTLYLENQRLQLENSKLARLAAFHEETSSGLAELLREQTEMNHNQARIINSLRRVLRFFGFDEVNIEDEYIELGEGE